MSKETIQPLPNRNKLFLFVFFWVFILTIPTKLRADGGESPNSVPPHEDLGVVDINQGLEAAHEPDYQYFDANYQQGANLGVTWNRWEVNWATVENEPGVLIWSCESSSCLPSGQGHGNYFDYPNLASADEDHNLESLVVLSEVPKCYQAGNTKPGCYIADPDEGIMQIFFCKSV